MSMLFEVGIDGVVSMRNVNVNTTYEILIINKCTNLKGPITLQGSKILLGYNEEVKFENEEKAKNAIKTILMSGL